VLTFESPEELLAHKGRRLGASAWVVIEQKTIDQFAAATGDQQWIHVDVARAAEHMPDGRTIAHGGLTLSLIPRLLPTIYRIRSLRQSINCGYDRVRFTAPVPAGCWVRLVADLVQARRVERGVRLVHSCIVELKGSEKPAMVAQAVSIAYGP